MQVLGRRKRLEELGAEALFVVHDEPEQVRATMLRGLDSPFPVLVDPERAAYAAWGLRRGSFAGVWLDPRVWLAYARLLASGERLHRLGQDTLQLGGDFVVDPAGTVVYSRPQEADDRPPVDELLRALELSARA